MILNKKNLDLLWVIFLAAGQGRRMRASKKNKVAYEISGKPIIQHAIDAIKKIGLIHIIVVIGFAKESVRDLLSKDIITVEQHEQLGTAHAVKVALPSVPDAAEHILVLNGDDSYLLTGDIISSLFEKHIKTNSSLTFLTAILDNPIGLGRIIRKDGKITNIIEEKEATQVEKEIHEVNAGCYLFNASFLREAVSEIEKSEVTGEYYVVDAIKIAFKKGLLVESITYDNLQWRGINTSKDLKEAERIFG